MFPKCDGDCFRPVCRAEFLKCGAKMYLYHVWADAEHPANLLIGKPACRGLEYFRLTGGKLRHRWIAVDQFHDILRD